MSSTWASHAYHTDSILPRPGELIKIRYFIAHLDFDFGPRSDGTRGTAASTPSSAARRLKKPPFHHVIVSAVAASPAGNISIQFFPVMSYSNPPPTFTGRDWNSAIWMQTQPEETTLRHLPIPAHGWSPAPPQLWGTTPLDFGAWRNDRPAWVTIVPRVHTIPGTETWKRQSPTVHLSPADLAALRDFQARVTVHFLARHTNVTVNRVTIPDYDDVWTGIFAPASGDCESNSDSDDEDDGGDGMDPVNFWRYEGAPKEMQEMVKRSDEEVMARMKVGICSWVQAVLAVDEDGGTSVEEEGK